MAAAGHNIIRSFVSIDLRLFFFFLLFLLLSLIILMVHYNNHKKKEREEKLNQTNQRPDQRFSRISPKKKKTKQKKTQKQTGFWILFRRRSLIIITKGNWISIFFRYRISPVAIVVQ